MRFGILSPLHCRAPGTRRMPLLIYELSPSTRYLTASSGLRALHESWGYALVERAVPCEAASRRRAHPRVRSHRLETPEAIAIGVVRTIRPVMGRLTALIRSWVGQLA